jgi:hypothetical protein
MEFSDSSSEDTKREEEQWTDRHDRYFQKLLVECALHTRLNCDSGYFFQSLFLVWGFLATTAPAILAILVGHFETDVWLAISSLIVSCVLNAIVGFFNFGQRAEKHFATQLLYEMLERELNVEMAKKRRFRLAVDVLMVKAMMRLGSIRQSESVIPVHVLRRHNIGSREELVASRATYEHAHQHKRVTIHQSTVQNQSLQQQQIA